MTLEFAGTMLCSAGVSYFHVYPNGDVYRCLADFNARRPPMFNLKRDGWKGSVDPTVCDHARETCPVFPGGGKRLHRSFEDPAAVEGGEEERRAAFRRVRDQIREYFRVDFVV